jgi:hypothetical protein
MTQDIEDKIEQIIKEQYYQSGLYGYLQENDPEIFIFLVQQIIPKHREKMRCEFQLENKKAELKKLEEKLSKTNRLAKARQATLRAWERDDIVRIPRTNIEIKLAYWLNNSLDWLLKVGLTVVPILSLFSIVGISLDDPLSKSGQFLFVLFCSIALVWLTSAMICNWIISLGKKNNDTNLPKNFIVLMFIIWLSEAFIGFATIPPLMDKIRSASGQEPLGALEKSEILIGVAVFAFINILFAIAKGRIYRFNLPKRIKYAKALSEWKTTEFAYENLVKEINDIEKKIKQLNEEIYPQYDTDYIKDRTRALSNEITLGREYRNQHPGQYVDK